MFRVLWSGPSTSVGIDPIHKMTSRWVEGPDALRLSQADRDTPGDFRVLFRVSEPLLVKEEQKQESHPGGVGGDR